MLCSIALAIAILFDITGKGRVKGNILMRNSNELLLARFINNTINTTTDRLDGRKLVQFTLSVRVVCRERAMRRRVGGTVFVGAVDDLRLGVEGQPAWHLAACLLRVCY